MRNFPRKLTNILPSNGRNIIFLPLKYHDGGRFGGPPITEQLNVTGLPASTCTCLPGSIFTCNGDRTCTQC
ncbi:hypothetical protein DERP_006664 [Dermatophagoides pteronyssinus]|uniref:Uncharacterized protein n=1 Tax=Dermatophagoides pteronyssinus TaxID=6956 RepID=A0ABQ8IR41_DERPT|nr:hypothetical protein DERP_006664 [Dermatophagoides pteronyssinus]